METNEVIIDNEQYEDFVEDSQETLSSIEVPVIENVDLNSAGFIGFGLASGMCILSVGIASILKIFKSAR